MLRDASKETTSQKRLSLKEVNQQKEVTQKFVKEAKLFKESLSEDHFARLCCDASKKSNRGVKLYK